MRIAKCSINIRAQTIVHTTVIVQTILWAILPFNIDYSLDCSTEYSRASSTEYSLAYVIDCSMANSTTIV